ncbi:unnamed protein product [Arabidopsis halleri]
MNRGVEVNNRSRIVPWDCESVKLADATNVGDFIQSILHFLRENGFVGDFKIWPVLACDEPARMTDIIKNALISLDLPPEFVNVPPCLSFPHTSQWNPESINTPPRRLTLSSRSKFGNCCANVVRGSQVDSRAGNPTHWTRTSAPPPFSEFLMSSSFSGFVAHSSEGIKNFGST